VTVGHHGFDVIVDGRFGRRPFIRLRFFAPTNQPGIVQIGVIGSAETGAGRVVRACPIFTPVVEIA